MCPRAIKEEVASLSERGLKVKLAELGGQCYVLVAEVRAPIPPWDQTRYDILIAVPAAYGSGALDGFYLALPYKFKEGNHPSVNGGCITVEGHQWQLVSWHYKDGKVWVPGVDNLDSHIVHCRGFFLNRGAINAY